MAENKEWLNAVIKVFDGKTGKADSIKRVQKKAG